MQVSISDAIGKPFQKKKIPDFDHFQYSSIDIKWDNNLIYLLFTPKKNTLNPCGLVPLKFSSTAK